MTAAARIRKGQRYRHRRKPSLPLGICRFAARYGILRRQYPGSDPKWHDMIAHGPVGTMCRACLALDVAVRLGYAQQNGGCLRFCTIIIDEITIKYHKILAHFHLLTEDADSLAYVNSYVCRLNCYFAFTSFFVDRQVAKLQSPSRAGRPGRACRPLKRQLEITPSKKKGSKPSE